VQDATTCHQIHISLEHKKIKKMNLITCI